MRLIPFGRYQGRRWSDVARSDPGYLAWMAERLDGRVREAAQDALVKMVFSEAAEDVTERTPGAVTEASQPLSN